MYSITRIDLNDFRRSIQSYYWEKKQAFKSSIKRKIPIPIRKVYYFSNESGSNGFALPHESQTQKNQFPDLKRSSRLPRPSNAAQLSAAQLSAAQLSVNKPNYIPITKQTGRLSVNRNRRIRR